MLLLNYNSICQYKIHQSLRKDLIRQIKLLQNIHLIQYVHVLTLHEALHF